MTKLIKVDSNDYYLLDSPIREDYDFPSIGIDEEEF